MDTPNIASPRVWFPIWLKLILALALFAILPGIIVARTLIEQNRADLIANQYAVQDATAAALEYSFSDVLLNAQDDLHTAAHAFANTDLDSALRLRLVLAIVGSSANLDHVDVYDRKGDFIDRIREKRPDTQAWTHTPDRQLTPALLKAARDKEIAFGALSVVEGSRRLLLVAPVRSQGRLTSYLATHVAFHQEALQQQINDHIKSHFNGFS
ncbi:MAG: hypothetical protein AAFS10_13545 [Myxococcota bacterium]